MMQAALQPLHCNYLSDMLSLLQDPMMPPALADPDAMGSDGDSSDGDSDPGDSEDDEPAAEAAAEAAALVGGQPSAVDIVLATIGALLHHADDLVVDFDATGQFQQADFAMQMMEAAEQLEDLLHQAANDGQVRSRS